MPENMKRTGFGQVEPNHLSAQRSKQIYAQLPAEDGIQVLENGQFVKYDYAKGVVDFTGPGEWMLVYNEIKLYDDWRETTKDFALQKKNYTPGSTTITHRGLGPFKGQMVPRVLKTNNGDLFTTNALVKGATSGNDVVDMGTAPTVGDVMKINATGFLEVDSASKEDPASSKEPMLWQVVKVYTLPDGQPAVKVMRIK